MSYPIDIRPGKPGLSGEPRPQEREAELADLLLESINDTLSINGFEATELSRICIPDCTYDPALEEKMGRAGLREIPFVVISPIPPKTKHPSMHAHAYLAPYNPDYIGLNFSGVVGAGTSFSEVNLEIIEEMPGCYFTDVQKRERSAYKGAVDGSYLRFGINGNEEVTIIAVHEPDKNKLTLLYTYTPLGAREALKNVKAALSRPTDKSAAKQEVYDSMDVMRAATGLSSFQLAELNDQARARGKKEAETDILVEGGMDPRKADMVLGGNGGDAAAGAPTIAEPRSTRYPMPPNARPFMSDKPAVKAQTVESRPIPKAKEGPLTKENYDTFVGTLERRFQEMGVLAQGQKLNPQKLFRAKTVLDEATGVGRYLTEANLLAQAFEILYYGEPYTIQNEKNLWIDMAYRDGQRYLRLKTLTFLPYFCSDIFLSAKQKENGEPYLFTHPITNPSLKSTRQHLPVTENLIVLGQMTGSRLYLGIETVVKPQELEELFKDGRLVDRNSLPTKAEADFAELSKKDPKKAFHEVKARVDALPHYYGSALVLPGTRQAYLHEGEFEIGVRALADDKKAVLTFTGLKRELIQEWIKSNPFDFSTLPKSFAGENDWLVLEISADGELIIEAGIAGLNENIKRESPTRLELGLSLESPVALLRLFNSLRTKKAPTPIFESSRKDADRFETPKPKRDHFGNYVRRQSDTAPSDKAWEDARKVSYYGVETLSTGVVVNKDKGPRSRKERKTMQLAKKKAAKNQKKKK